MATPLYVPINQPIVPGQSVTIPWRQFFQSLNGNLGPVTGAITELTGDVTAGPGPGSVAATIANLAVTTGKIANDAVTYAKMQNVSAASRLLGRGSAAGAGDVEEIQLGSGMSMSGTTLSATGTGGTVTNSGTLTADQLILGNGTTVVKSIGTAGTATTLLHGGAPPTYAAVSLTADVSGVLPAANYEAAIYKTTTTLTNADIIALPTTPFNVVAAPGNGFFIGVLRCDVVAKVVTAYSGCDADAWISIHTADWQTDILSYLVNGNGTGLTQVTGFLETAAQTADWVPESYVQGSGDFGTLFTDDWGLAKGAGVDAGSANNQPLEMYFENNGAGNLGGGAAGNSMVVTTLWVKVAIP